MENPNLMALDLVDEAIDFADELDVGVHHLDNDAAVLDFGIDHDGGVEAGLLLVEVSTGGLATVQARLGDVGGAAITHVDLTTDHPRRSLLACQAPGWSLDTGGITVRGGGPAQLSRAGGPGAADRDDRDLDEADFAVLVVESARPPDEDLIDTVAAETDVPTSGVFVIAAPRASIAGGLASAARAAESAVRRVIQAGDDPDRVRSVTASAPVPPLATDESAARARSAAAIAYGGRAHLVVEGDVDRPDELVHGEGSLDGADDRPPAPAQVTMDVAGGPTHVVGAVDEERLGDRMGL